MPCKELHDRTPVARDRLTVETLATQPAREHAWTVMDGWHYDAYHAELPAEPPGEPLPDGSWEVARQIMLGYQFTDPQIIPIVYFFTTPNDERLLMLQSRFLVLTFLLPVLVKENFVEQREEETGQVSVCDFAYVPLKGHVEEGWMRFEVAKQWASGAVSFSIHSCSRPAPIPNPIFRLGDKLVGRWIQVRYGRHGLARMQTMVQAQLAARARGEALPPPNGPTLRPARDSERAMRELREVLAHLHES